MRPSIGRAVDSHSCRGAGVPDRRGNRRARDRCNRDTQLVFLSEESLHDLLVDLQIGISQLGQLGPLRSRRVEHVANAAQYVVSGSRGGFIWCEWERAWRMGADRIGSTQRMTNRARDYSRVRGYYSDKRHYRTIDRARPDLPIRSRSTRPAMRTACHGLAEVSRGETQGCR